VQRTDSYKRWLEDNPLQAIIAGDGGDDDEEADAEEDAGEAAPRGEAHRR